MKTLDILIGNIGSGKSTFAKEYAEKANAIIFSSDKIRKNLFEENVIQNDHSFKENQIVFEILYQKIAESMQEGCNIIFDATNLTCKDRKTILDLGKEYKYKIIGRLFLLNDEECERRVINRQNTDKESHYIEDPMSVIKRYSEKLKNNMPKFEEGFTQIVTYQNNEEVSNQNRILIATGNIGKIAIYSCVFDKLGLPYCSLKDIQVDVDIAETGETELENAYLKAKGYHEATGLPVIANDSGLIIEKFSKEDQPGVFVRRYGGKELSDEETIEIFSKKLEAVGGSSDSYFNVALVLCDYEGQYHQKTFKSYRYMVAKPSKVVQKGLPLRSLDYNKEYGKYMSEMTIEEANASEGKCIEEQQQFIEEVFMKKTKD